MAVRERLQGLLYDAWEVCIKKDYRKQRVNSERSLQAAFWSRLNSKLPAEKFRMFIEPRIKTDFGQLYPDIVICNTVRVICVVELKYLPRTKPNYEKDIESLATIARNRRKLRIANSRYRGPAGDPKNYKFDDNLLCVWAGVHRPPSSGSLRTSQLLSKGTRILSGRFMQLHAETDHDAHPDVFSRAN